MLSNFYENALLAMAGYANLIDGSVQSQKNDLLDSGMSQEQIKEFAQSWTDVRVYSSIVTGLRVNVFRNGADGWKHRNGKNLIRADDGIGTVITQN